MVLIPEPVTIVTTTTALLGFIVVVRNTIQTVHDDIDTYRHFKQYLTGLLENIDERIMKIEDWKKQWMVWNAEKDEHLHKHLWGDNGRSDIFKCLERVVVVCERAEKALNNLSRKRTRFRRVLQKLDFITMKKKAINEFLTEINSLITDLNVKADRYFREEHSNIELNSDSIHELGNGFNLSRLAVATWTASDELLLSCEQTYERIQMDLEIDFFKLDVKNMLQRSQFISDSAATNQLKYKFSAKKEQRDIPAVKLLLQTQPGNPQSPPHDALSLAFDEILRQPTRLESFFQVPGTSRFLLRKLDANGATGGLHSVGTNGYSEWHSFREILSGPTLHNLDQVYEDKQDQRKMKLALQLVETGLLFLGSRWSDNLCSCKLGRRGPIDLEYNFWLSGGSSNHFPPKWEDHDQNYCWCRNGFPETYQDHKLRYLGILLIEVAIGGPIYDVRDIAASTRTTGVIDLAYMPLQQTISIDETKRKVQESTSSSTYADVVEFCLKSSWSRSSFLSNNEAQIKNKIELYYLNVVAP